MVEPDEETRDVSELPLPPLPPGIALPPPPPPPPPPLPQEDISVEDDEPIDDSESESNEDQTIDSTDFQAQWEKRRTSDPTLSIESKDSMYGHIDRIATGDVGTLLDRFSDRFGSELDREIIVLRKQQQQDIRAVKPTVELISAPEIENQDAVSEEIQTDNFVEFFQVVNNLLGDMPEEFINKFVKSDSFVLFENVGANPGAANEDDRKAFFLMINNELGELPEDKINEFVESAGFEVFTSMGEKYGG